MFAPEIVEPAVDFLFRLADSGPALEFAIGTGRIGIPLMRRGLAVTGLNFHLPWLTFWPQRSAPLIFQLSSEI